MEIIVPRFKIFSFGEKVDGYRVNVVNEREVRAGSGLLFLFAMIAFLSAWFTGEFYLMKLFVTAFVFDFIIRIFINPKYSPSLVLGRFMVRNQVVEYSGAPQKKFAWGSGLILGSIMFYLVVILQSFGPINLLLCITCLILLFFESSFGICIGCKLYNFVKKENGELCPGGVCTPHKKEKIQRIDIFQILFVVVLVAIMSIVTSSGIYIEEALQVQSQIPDTEKIIDENCIVPEWAAEIGHEDLWKLHNGCE